jgi:hypothetical protein
VLGFGPEAYSVEIATDDPRWAGALVARAGDVDLG